jgi:quercetin dioxygenase-like cupin family protein
MSRAEPVVVGPGEGKTIEGPAGGPLTFKVRGEQTGGRLTAFENRIAPGDGPPLHTHEREDELFYVVAGDFRFRLGDEISAAPAGTFVLIPPGTPHCFQNVGEGEGTVLVVFTPSGMEGFFDRFAELTEVDPEAFARLGKEVGMDIVGPPLAATHPQ